MRGTIIVGVALATLSTVWAAEPIPTEQSGQAHHKGGSTPTADDTEPIIVYGEQMAKMWGLKLERPSSTAILGRWNEGEAGKHDCGDGEFFREFRDDGYAYQEV